MCVEFCLTECFTNIQNELISNIIIVFFTCWLAGSYFYRDDVMRKNRLPQYRPFVQVAHLNNRSPRWFPEQKEQ